MSENLPAKLSHSCGDSALKCVDCNGSVCPKCFVQCEVGNRCKKCASRFTSHVLLVNPKVLLKLSLAGIGLGIVWGYVQPHLQIMGFYGYLIQFAAAAFCGKMLHRSASYKLGAKVTAVALIALLIGLALGPSRDALLLAIEFSKIPETQGGDSQAIGEVLINLAIFLTGALLPFVRRS